MRHFIKKAALIVLSLTLVLMPGSAWAVGSGGFENASFSGISLSQGNAVVARPEEPASLAYNPAGIVDLPGVQVQTGTGFISNFTWYDGEDTGQPDMRSSGTLNMVPTGYITINPGKVFNDRLAFGVGMDAPFGLSNKYDQQHEASRYTGARNSIKMFALRMALALKLHDKLSVAAGPMFYRVFDTGSIMAYPNRLIQVTGPFPAPPTLPWLQDGQYRAEGFHGTGWGWQAGVLYKPSPKHAFGYYFRSPVNVRTRGRIKVEGSAFTGATGNFEIGGRADLNFPFNMTWAYAWKPNGKSEIEFDLGYTRWSIFKRLFIDPTDNVTGADDAIVKALGNGAGDYRDTFSLHLGGSHDWNERLTLRGGTHFYWTPLPKHNFRPALPDANRVGVSAGFSYDLTRNLAFDLAYYHTFYFTRKVDNSLSDALGARVDGSYFSYLQEAFFSFRYMWEPGTLKQESNGVTPMATTAR